MKEKRVPSKEAVRRAIPQWIKKLERLDEQGEKMRRELEALGVPVGPSRGPDVLLVKLREIQEREKKKSDAKEKADWDKFFADEKKRIEREKKAHAQMIERRMKKP